MSTLPHTPGEFGEPPARPAAARGPGYYVFKALKALASLQLTVVLFALGVVLVFFGTLAQLDNGIWTIVDQYFYSTVVWVPFELTHRFLGVFWKEYFPPGESPWTGSFPMPGGLGIGVVMVVNLLAAHAVRFRLSWKRAGIFLIHSGVVLLFVGEFVTREYAVEQQMTIPEGGSANYAEDTRNAELAFVDRSAPDGDRVTVVTQKRLMAAKPGERITHPDLPVDIEVLEFMKNADFKDPGPGVQNRATAGAGVQVVAVWRKEESGVETKQRGDFTSAYVRLYKKGTNDDLGVYLGSLLLSMQNQSDPVTVDGKTYQMTLRRARIYKPYTVHLDKFKFDKYEGTAKAKNYSSDVRVKDADGTEMRRHHIAMNEPLRYAGETFYQSSFDRAETTTILQVVKNPGLFNFGLFYATIDYIACALVGFGLVLHFGIHLTQFLRRKQSPLVAAAAAAPVSADGATLARVTPWVMLGLAALVLLTAFARTAPKSLREPYDLDGFARIPVVEGGRTKPLESIARVSLRTVSHRETFVDENGDTQPAIKWYLDLIAAGHPDDNSAAWKHKVFRIENDQVRAELKLDDLGPREGLRYSYAEIRPRLPELEEKATAAHPDEGEEAGGPRRGEDDRVGGAHRDGPGAQPTEGAERGRRGHAPGAPPGERHEVGGARPRVRGGRTGRAAGGDPGAGADPEAAFQLPQEDRRRIVRLVARTDLNLLDKATQNKLFGRVMSVLTAPADEIPPNMRAVCLKALFIALPPAEAERVRADMGKESRAHMAATPAGAGWAKMLAAYRDQKPSEFNAAVADYRGTFAAAVPDTREQGNWAARRFYGVFNTLGGIRTEVTYNRVAPFYLCIVLYLFGFLLAVFGFVLHAAESPVWAGALRRSALYALTLTLVFHTLALLVRMYVMERPGVFVTNLYASAVFIGWGCVALCLVLERLFPIGVGNVLAAVLGLATTIVAHNLGTEDTMGTLVAVLDTNFWLATHVTTVTLGYTATFVAGFLGDAVRVHDARRGGPRVVPEHRRADGRRAAGVRRRGGRGGRHPAVLALVHDDRAGQVRGAAVAGAVGTVRAAGRHRRDVLAGADAVAGVGCGNGRGRPAAGRHGARHRASRSWRWR